MASKSQQRLTNIWVAWRARASVTEVGHNCPLGEHQTPVLDNSGIWCKLRWAEQVEMTVYMV